MAEEARPGEALPRITGWTVHRDGPYLVATRQEPLPEFAERFGALAEVDARTVRVLVALCRAQLRLSRDLAIAEELEKTAPNPLPKEKEHDRRSRPDQRPVAQERA